MAFLQIIKGNHPGKILELRDERTVLGRHPSCEIVVDNAAVSRRHAQILSRHGEFVLEDLQSRNCTFLNGVLLDAKAPLHDADEFKIGNAVFKFFDPSEKIPAQESTRDPLGESSTIVATLNAKSAPVLHLGVKPEAKLGALLEISNDLAQALELGGVLQSLLDGLLKVFPQVDSGLIVLNEPDDKKTVVRASRPGGAEAAAALDVSDTMYRQAMDQGEAILSVDPLKSGSREGPDRPGVRSAMCVPLINRQGRALGAIHLQDTGLGPQITQGDLDVLVSIGSQAVLAIENARLHADLLQRSHIETELTVAAQIQHSFLPHQRPHPPGYECSDYYEPAQRVGGDYFDYVSLPDGRVAIALADVAGKGIPAALLMARLYSAIRLHLFTQPTPAQVLSALSEEVFLQGIGHRFITFVLLQLDPETHELTIANAGHPLPIVRSAEGRVVSIGWKDSGVPLGISREQDYRELKLALEPGAAIIVYTDGVTEARSPADELFGLARLEQLVAAVGAPAEELVKTIVREVDSFCGSRHQWDDMCLVCLRRLPSSVN